MENRVIPKEKDIVVIGGNYSQNIKEEELRSDVYLKELDSIPKGLKTKYFFNTRTKKKFRAVFTVGAAGELVPLDVMKIREMTDPLNFAIRKWLTDSAFQDPTLTVALQRRNDAFFSDDFELTLELKSMVKKGIPESSSTNQTSFLISEIPASIDTPLNSSSESTLTPDEAAQEVEIYKKQYAGILDKLEAWRKLPTINVLEKMKRSHISTIVQGRSLVLILPKLSELSLGQLPVSLRVVTWQDTGQVLVDTLFWQILAVRLFFPNKNIATPEEMIYITGKNWGLRRESDYYGAAELEAFIQMSRINKKVLNYDIGKAAEAGYITKLILSVMTEGDQGTRQSTVANLVNQIISQGTDVVGLETGATVTPVPITVDTPMLDMITKLLDDRLISAAGATKAQMGRTAELNRDTATIMEVENIRTVRTPDEKLIKTAYETQLFDPLFAKLAGKKFEELPVRVVIKRKQPTDEARDPRLEQKQKEIDATSEGESKPGLVQEDAKNKTFGAAAYWASNVPGWNITPLQLFEAILELPKPTLDKIMNRYHEFKTKKLPGSGGPKDLQELKTQKEIELLDAKIQVFKDRSA